MNSKKCDNIIICEISHKKMQTSKFPSTKSAIKRNCTKEHLIVVAHAELASPFSFDPILINPVRAQ